MKYVLNAKSSTRKLLEGKLDEKSINDIWMELADTFSAKIHYYLPDESGNLKKEEFFSLDVYTPKQLAFLCTEKGVSILYSRNEAYSLCEGTKGAFL